MIKFLHKSRRLKAFSLLEVALAIAIAGIAVSCITPIWHTITITKKQRMNEERFHYIRTAMQAYLMRFGYLPCAAANENGFATNETYAGFVPYKTLGIAKQYSKDCEGKPFTFAVNKNLVKLPGKNYILFPKQACSTNIPNQVSFCKLYGFKPNASKEHTIYYCADEICTLPNLALLDNEESIIDPNDFYHVLPHPEVNLSGYYSAKWQKQVVLEKPDDRKVCNTVAWLLIMHGPNKHNKPLSKAKEANIVKNAGQQIFYLSAAKDDKGLFNDIVFYQTRFDMAAQCACPCNTDAIIYLYR